MRLILAAATANRDEFPRLVRDIAATDPLVLLEVADVVVDHLDLAGADLAPVERSILDFPDRWLPGLRRSLASGGKPQAHAAARLLARHGTRADLVVLSAWEQTYCRQSRSRQLTVSLSRRVTPVLHLHDIGRTEFSIDSHTVLMSQVRRKAAGLLLFLASRPGQTAGRELVLDGLWPDSEPHDALNSLHQALYYLRRSIDQWYEDSVSADYIVLESEIVYLDPELVAVDSVRFHRDAVAALSSPHQVSVAADVLATYRGMFAPEFEYEEWAIDYRHRTHALYLSLVHAVAESQLASGSYREAATSLAAALRIDPDAFELEGHLVRALWLQGTRAAAMEHYRHFAHAHQRELGLQAPRLEELLQSGRNPAQHT